MTKNADPEALEALRPGGWIGLEPGETVYTSLRHVSSSGMTRWIDLYAMRAILECRFVSPEGHTCCARSDPKWTPRPAGSLGTHVLYGVLACAHGEEHYRPSAEPVRLTPLVARACGFTYDRRREALKIGGCGMDMGFHVVSTLSRVLFRDQPRADYLLHHRWLG